MGRQPAQRAATPVAREHPGGWPGWTGPCSTLAEVTPGQQRAVARWAARQAGEVAGLDTVDWIAAGFAALDRGEPLPPPFDDKNLAWQWLWADERVPRTAVTTATGTPNFSQQALAFATILRAAHDDPLVAAVDAVFEALLAHCDDHRAFTAAVRTAFPALAGAG